MWTAEVREIHGSFGTLRQLTAWDVSHCFLLRAALVAELHRESEEKWGDLVIDLAHFVSCLDHDLAPLSDIRAVAQFDVDKEATRFVGLLDISMLPRLGFVTMSL
jgi:hypothetical protein